MSATTIEDIKPEVLEGMLACTRIKHQVTDTGWKQLHRLVGTIEGSGSIPSVIVEGGWTAYENPAILSVEELAAACGFLTDDANIEVEPTRGFLGFSEYWQDQMPRVVLFNKSPRDLEYEEIDWDKVQPMPSAEVDDAEEADESEGGTPD